LGEDLSAKASSKLGELDAPTVQTLQIVGLYVHCLIAAFDTSRGLREVLENFSTLAQLSRLIYEANGETLSFVTGMTHYDVVTMATATYFVTALSMAKDRATGSIVCFPTSWRRRARGHLLDDAQPQDRHHDQRG